MRSFILSKGLLISWTLASAPLVVYFIVSGRVRFGVVAAAVAIAGLVLGSRAIKWAFVGAMAGMTIGGFAGWFLVNLRDDPGDQAVLGVILGGFVGVTLGTLSGAMLAARTAQPR